MRDFLEEAHAHRQDGYGRAQAADKVPLMKRFYTAATVAPVGGEHAVLLDAKPVKTPGGKPVRVPTRALAEGMVEEWEAQQSHIDFRGMPLVRLAHSAVESGPEGAAAFRDEIIRFAGNDMMLYRADTPDSLVAEQEKHWDPVLVALARTFDVKFQPTIGIIHQPQPETTLRTLAATLAEADHFSLVGLMQITSLTGSGLLALAHRHGLIDADAAWTAAHVDEDHNIRLWGEDEDAKTRRALRRVEYDAALRLLERLSD